MNAFKDYEIDRENKRGGWIWEIACSFFGAIGMATLVYVSLAICALSIGCEEDFNYSPEIQNAETLKPIADTALPEYCESETHSLTVTCDNITFDWSVWDPNEVLLDWIAGCEAVCLFTVGTEIKQSTFTVWESGEGLYHYVNFHVARPNFGVGPTVTATPQVHWGLSCTWMDCTTGGVGVANATGCGGRDPEYEGIAPEDTLTVPGNPVVHVEEEYDVLPFDNGMTWDAWMWSMYGVGR